MADKSVAIIGNPNSGKTAIFNVLTGLNQKVSNYPGVTVEQVTGKANLGIEQVEILDLPGTYSLVPESHDEQIVSQEFANWALGINRPGCIISVVDAINLKRNLYLTS